MKNIMRLLVAAIISAAWIGASVAQNVYGPVAPGHVIGNGTSQNPRAPTDASIGAILDQGIGSSNGCVPVRGVSSWGCGSGGGGGSPGGANTNIQFNNSTAFGGSANLTWNNSTNTFSVTGLINGTDTLTGTIVTSGSPTFFKDYSPNFFQVTNQGATDTSTHNIYGAFFFNKANSSSVNSPQNGLGAGLEVDATASGNQGAFGGSNFWMRGNANLGGILATPVGQGIGVAGTCFLSSSSTFWFGCTGAQFGTNVAAGASVALRSAAVFGSIGADAVQGSSTDAMALFSNEAAATVVWKNGLMFNAAAGAFPFNNTSDVVGFGAGTVHDVLNASALTVAHDFIEGPSDNFLVDGNGNAYAASGFFGVSGGPTLGTLKFNVRLGANENVGISDNGGTAQISALTDALALTNFDIVGSAIAVTTASNFSINTNFFVANNGLLTIELDNIGSTSTSAEILQNTTAAAAGAQQMSPRFKWLGQGWKTNATAASQEVDWIAEVVPVQGAANPTSYLSFSSQINSAGYNQRFALFSSGAAGLGSTTDPGTAGVFNVSTGFRVGNAAASGNVLRGNGTNFVAATLAVSDLSGLGTGVAAALGNAVNASGGIISPTPSAAGDTPYWNGTTWAKFAGNNSGTQCYTQNASGVPAWGSCGSGGGTPGGANTDVQFNNSSAFGGDSGFTYAGSGQATLALGTITANAKALNITATWNNSGVTFDAPIFENVTNTASNAASLIADLQIGGTTFFGVGTDSARTGTQVTAAGTELVLRQTGDTFGTTQLALVNRNGENGAVFTNLGLDLVDFGFVGSSTAEQSVRFEHRGGSLIDSSNTAGEFQIGVQSGTNQQASQIFSWGLHSANYFNGGNGGSPAAVSLYVYNTISNGPNYERGAFDWTTNANVLTVGTQKTGTGGTRNMEFVVGGTNELDFGITNASAWNFASSLFTTAHYLANGAAPTLGACGTSPSITGSDVAGKITVGSGTVTSCAITFHTTWGAAPACTISSASAITSPTVATTTTTMTIGGSSLTSFVISYHCFSTAWMKPANDNIKFAEIDRDPITPAAAVERQRHAVAA